MLDEKEPEFHFKITLEDTEMKIEHTYKEACNPNSEHDLSFPSLPAKLDAIIAALKASGHSEKEIENDMKEYIEWQESDVWGVLRKVEEQLGILARSEACDCEEEINEILKMIEEVS